MSSSLTLVVVAKSQEELGKFQLEHVRHEVDELVLLVNSGARFGGISVIGNHALNHSRGDVVGIVHADTSFAAGTLAKFSDVAGGGRWLAWWAEPLTEPISGHGIFRSRAP